MRSRDQQGAAMRIREQHCTAEGSIAQQKAAEEINEQHRAAERLPGGEPANLRVSNPPLVRSRELQRAARRPFALLSAAPPFLVGQLQQCAGESSREQQCVAEISTGP